jgi:hypothetical protein
MLARKSQFKFAPRWLRTAVARKASGLVLVATRAQPQSLPQFQLIGVPLVELKVIVTMPPAMLF